MGVAAVAAPSPAEKAIASARQVIEKNPKAAAGYNALALAQARRARETADTAYYIQAEESLKKSFALEANNFEGRKVLGWVMLGKHEFAEALKLAVELNRQMKDDVTVYGLLADAHTQLGNYKEAEQAVQWMLNIGRSSIPGLTRAAHLRELFGDTEGALELMRMAYDRLSPSEAEDRAWVLTHAAHLQLLTGNTAAADELAGQALALFPDYHYALGQLAKVRAAQSRYTEAASLQSRRYQAAPHPENLYELAVAQKKAGLDEEARASFARFEKGARAEMKSWDNANRELIFYYTDHAARPQDALEVARLEVARRQDVPTLDAYAWALFKNGEEEEAKRQMARALAVGVRDPELLHRAEEMGAKSSTIAQK
jgi:tetratricopeptide (TPR) repeat protein